MTVVGATSEASSTTPPLLFVSRLPRDPTPSSPTSDWGDFLLLVGLLLFILCGLAAFIAGFKSHRGRAPGSIALRHVQLHGSDATVPSSVLVEKELVARDNGGRVECGGAVQEKVPPKFQENSSPCRSCKETSPSTRNTCALERARQTSSQRSPGNKSSASTGQQSPLLNAQPNEGARQTSTQVPHNSKPSANTGQQSPLLKAQPNES